ncbi:hypothetical protein SODG_000456 [Sodalis praecaptivus]
MINNSLPRVTEGIRQWRAHPGATMVFTGAAAPGNPVSSAEAASRVAQSLGVPASAIVVLDSPRDTRQEAANVAMLVGQAPLMLVTSANHLPRAMGFLPPQGLSRCRCRQISSRSRAHCSRRKRYCPRRCGWATASASGMKPSA